MNPSNWRAGEGGPVIGQEIPTPANAGRVVSVNSRGLLGFDVAAAPYFVGTGGFDTIQEAIDAGAAAGVAFQVLIASGTYNEDLTFPTSVSMRLGFASWDIWDAPAINGDINLTGGAGVLLVENCQINGAISGGGAASWDDVIFSHCALSGPIDVRGAPAANPRLALVDVLPLNGGQGAYAGDIQCGNRIAVQNTELFGTIVAGSQSGFGITCKGCTIDAGAAFATSALVMFFADCDPQAMPTFTFTGAAGVVKIDGWTMSQLKNFGVPAVVNGTFDLWDGT